MTQGTPVSAVLENHSQNRVEDKAERNGSPDPGLPQNIYAQDAGRNRGAPTSWELLLCAVPSALWVKTLNVVESGDELHPAY